MIVRKRNMVATVVALVAMVSLVTAQITFSRDWTGGKRAAPLPLDCNQFARLCRHFLHEMKSAMSPGTDSKRHRDDPPPLYDDE